MSLFCETSPKETKQIEERLTVRVKWFNNRAGYGFITVTDGVRSGTDVFVHHTAITVANQQYKYLIQGEYVDFTFTLTQGGIHSFNAKCVTGIKNGSLMCETINETKTQSSYQTNGVGDSKYTQRMNEMRPHQIKVYPHKIFRRNDNVPGAPRADSKQRVLYESKHSAYSDP